MNCKIVIVCSFVLAVFGVAMYYSPNTVAISYFIGGVLLTSGVIIGSIIYACFYRMRIRYFNGR